MDVLSVVTFAGGLAFFLYGMSVLSGGLERLAGGKLEKILRKLTAKRFAGLLAGAGITVAVQSSSAVTVMLVGLVNSGIIEPAGTVGIIMGSNVGTTLTSWLLASVGLKTESVGAALFKPENFSLILALIGAAMLIFSKKAKTKDSGTILVGFGILMTGMKFMSSGVAPLASSPTVARLMLAFENPFLAVLAGAVFTGLIQSSSASVGILQAVAVTGQVSFAAAFPIIVGQNIGTCVTAAISCIGVGRKAKKVTLIHVLFNVIGAILFLSVYYILNAFIAFPFASRPISALGVAVTHTVFNISVTAVLFPLSFVIVKLCDIILPDKEEDRGGIKLPDKRLLITPFAATSDSFRAVSEMASCAENAVTEALGGLFEYSEKYEKKIKKSEKQLDRLEDGIASFLVSLSKTPLSDYDSLRVSGMLHVITDFERLGDHAENISLLSKEIYEKKITFSDNTLGEISIVSNALYEIISMSVEAYRKGDVALAKRVEPLEQVIDSLISEIRDHHINRLREGITTLEKGFILSDMLIGFERISDHCSNIAVTVISLSRGILDSHSYLNDVRRGDPEFVRLFDLYSKEYALLSLKRK